jgi:abhydrolase domain-containing protein 13
MSDSWLNWGVGYLSFFAKLSAAGLAVLLAALYANQDKLLYHPTPPGAPPTPSDSKQPFGCRNPGEYDMITGKYKPKSSSPIPYIEEYVLTKDGQNIHIWKMYQQQSTNAPTLVYFHGNAGNMGFRLENAALMYATAKINIVMMDYRGYGHSSGIPSEDGLQEDAIATLNHIRSDAKLKNTPIILFGRSLGGAVAIHLAHYAQESIKMEVAGVIVENTFLSIDRMVDSIFPVLSYRLLKNILLRIGWRNDAMVTSIKCPMMFIAGDRDEIVPHAHMIELYGLAKSTKRKEIYVINGGDHNSCFIIAGREYYRRLATFTDNLRSDGMCAVLSMEKHDNNSSYGGGAGSGIPTMQRDFSVR